MVHILTHDYHLVPRCSRYTFTHEFVCVIGRFTDNHISSLIRLIGYFVREAIDEYHFPWQLSTDSGNHARPNTPGEVDAISQENMENALNSNYKHKPFLEICGINMFSEMPNPIYPLAYQGRGTSWFRRRLCVVEWDGSILMEAVMFPHVRSSRVVRLCHLGNSNKDLTYPFEGFCPMSIKY